MFPYKLAVELLVWWVPSKELGVVSVMQADPLPVMKFTSNLTCSYCCSLGLHFDKPGYVIYRRVLRYYSGEEDGLDTRKALSRDVEKKSTIPPKRPVTPGELEYD
ncbi:hypothetical protein D5086_004477 [Populus alba]|uniref:Uncharacterized protein n=1 Tax=Populus alba TaxID=43335 RepID=A0ACC4CRM1_POPAL